MLTLCDLDTFRADAMRAMLTEDGRGQVWLYDVGSTRQAYREALYDQNYDNIQRDGEGIKAGQPYCLTGPGIEDHPFATPAELLELIRWLCTEGYLSCYARPVWQWQPHLEADQAAIREIWEAEPDEAGPREREKGDDDGMEYGHPEDRLKGRE